MQKKFLKISSTTSKILLFIGIIVLCWLLSRYFSISLSDIRIYLSRFPIILSGVIFVFLYVGVTTLVWFGPKDVLRVAAAMFFGAYVSTVFVWLGEIGNAIVLFHISRKLGREFVREKFKITPKDDLVKSSHTDWLGLISLRLNPLIPFRLMDLSLGLTALRFRRYLFIIVLVSPIRIFWLQAILAKIGDQPLNFENIWSVFLRNINFIYGTLIYFAVIIFISLLALIFRLFMRGKRKSLIKNNASNNLDNNTSNK